MKAALQGNSEKIMISEVSAKGQAVITVSLRKAVCRRQDQEKVIQWRQCNLVITDSYSPAVYLLFTQFPHRQNMPLSHSSNKYLIFRLRKSLGISHRQELIVVTSRRFAWPRGFGRNIVGSGNQWNKPSRHKPFSSSEKCLSIREHLEHFYACRRSGLLIVARKKPSIFV